MNTQSRPSQPWSLVVCGGGSGGHLFPALAVIEELRRRDAAPERIVFLTADRPIDRQILAGQGVEQYPLSAVNSHEMLRQPWRSVRGLVQAVWKARRILNELPAPSVLGTGGFSSLPGVMAARWCNCPILLLEQNVVPGRATSVLSRFADLICLSFAETRGYLSASTRVEVTGNPVRSVIAQPASSVLRTGGTLLILGGSQGATAVNDGMVRFLQRHSERLSNWTVLHQTGASAQERIQQVYRDLGVTGEVASFFPNLPELYYKADVVVTRAGGTSLAEIACAGCPAVIIPYPNSLRDHQLVNARHYAARGAAILVEQNPESGYDSALEKGVLMLIEEDAQRAKMAQAMRACAMPDAAAQVCDRLLTMSWSSETKSGLAQ